MEKPENVTATRVNDDSISLTWQESLSHPPEFFYNVRISHFPHTSHRDVFFPGNVTSYDVNVTKHAGQNFTFQVRTATQEWSSGFSDPVTIQTSMSFHSVSFYLNHFGKQLSKLVSLPF